MIHGIIQSTKNKKNEIRAQAIYLSSLTCGSVCHTLTSHWSNETTRFQRSAHSFFELPLTPYYYLLALHDHNLSLCMATAGFWLHTAHQRLLICPSPTLCPPSPFINLGISNGDPELIFTLRVNILCLIKAVILLS